VLFAALSIGLAVTAVWGRMTFQRSWRGWVSRHQRGGHKRHQHGKGRIAVKLEPHSRKGYALSVSNKGSAPEGSTRRPARGWE
jgi:hypothetical protein